MLHGLCNGEKISRPYTPVSLDKYTNGVAELLYKPVPSSNYPRGKMGNYLMSLNEGDQLTVSGLVGRISYTRINNASVEFSVRLSFSTPPYSVK
ncbi:hypothetical protein A3Q56_02632 [Intoshia linei]|uniref:cytochrome-b5 reductase n=1 Tax=Intoshia linei TaxID=1819745 RepID=A0A177B865_9BILA|nr:hypothetical protein A3Q56_02632 [Intoshia linei]